MTVTAGTSLHLHIGRLVIQGADDGTAVSPALRRLVEEALTRRLAGFVPPALATDGAIGRLAVPCVPIMPGQSPAAAAERIADAVMTALGTPDPQRPAPGQGGEVR